jgi:SOS-response transcriptional repressor LexA
MKTENEIRGERVKKLREAKGWSQAELAERCGWDSQSRVGNYESGIRGIKPAIAEILAKALDITPAELLYGETSATKNESSLEDIGMFEIKLKRIPVISFVQAGVWTTTGDPIIPSDVTDWVPADESLSEFAFALQVRGDSMERRNGGKSIPDGAIACVEPIFDPLELNGKVVAAMLDGSDEATIKEFRIDGPNKYLIPWNDRYDVIKVNGNCRIVGYIKDVIIRF